MKIQLFTFGLSILSSLSLTETKAETNSPIDAPRAVVHLPRNADGQVQKRYEVESTSSPAQAMNEKVYPFTDVFKGTYTNHNKESVINDCRTKIIDFYNKTLQANEAKYDKECTRITATVEAEHVRPPFDYNGDSLRAHLVLTCEKRKDKDRRVRGKYVLCQRLDDEITQLAEKESNVIAFENKLKYFRLLDCEETLELESAVIPAEVQKTNPSTLNCEERKKGR